MRIMNRIYPYIKSYRWQSIFIKYFIAFLLAIAIPFTTLTVSIFSSFRNTYSRNILTTLSSTTSSYTSSIENTLRNVNTSASLLAVNDYVLAYLATADDYTDDLYTYNLGQRIYELFRHSLLSNEYIHSIQLYNRLNDSIATFGENKRSDYKFIFDEYFAANMPNCALGHRIIDNSTVNAVTLYHEVYISSAPVGVLAINLNADKLFKNLIKQSSDSINNLAFYTTSGDMLYSFRDNSPVLLSDENIAVITDTPILLKSDQQYKLIASTLDNMPYILCVDYINSNSFTYIWLIELICIFIMLIISFIMAYNLSLYFYKSLAGILTIIEDTPNANHKQKPTDEINFLSSSILSIIQRNEQIEQELTEKTLSFQRSQMQALQLQINPHFIFNTLQFASTSAISILKKDTPVSRILSMLADLIYAVYQIDDYLIPLRQELQYAKDYIEIQSMRYDYSFTVKYDIDEDMLDAHVIKFTLQPILENAVTHGLMPVNCTGNIKISAQQHDDILVLQICDTGVGISPEKLSDLCSSLTLDGLADGKGIGLRNTQQRIRNVFGIDYGLTVDSDGTGTTVTIRLPIVTQ